MPSFCAQGRVRVGGYLMNNLSNGNVEKSGECCDGEVDKDGEIEDDGETDTDKTPTMQMMEMNLEISPGEKVSVTVDCQAK